ncbi:MAG: outer membrane protein assembly factor BamB family protein [Planctomycetota bacterium]
MRKAAFLGFALLLAGVSVHSAAAGTAESAVKASGVDAGLCVHLGVTDGKLTAELRSGGKFLVHGLAAEAGSVAKARAYIASKGLYGQVSVERCDTKTLPYAENLVNLIVAEDLGALLGKGPGLKEIFRVTAPYGVLCFGGEVDAGKLKAAGFSGVRTSDGWAVATKPWPKEMGEWPMHRHGPDGNPVSKDTLIGPATDLRWRATRTWDRPGWYPDSGWPWVSAGGRIFQVCGRALVARDAFNGLILWTRPIKASFHVHRSHNVVATRERLFITLEAKGPLVSLDAATGKVLCTYTEAGRPGRVVHHQGRLFMSGGAFDVKTGKQLWKGATGSFLLSEGKLIAVGEASLSCLNPETGKQLWSTPLTGRTFYKGPSSFGYGGTLIRVMTKSSRPAKGAPLVIEGYSVTTGKLLWTKPFKVLQRFLSIEVCGAQALLWVHAVVDSNPKTGNTGKHPSAWLGLDPKTGEVKKCFEHRTGDKAVERLIHNNLHRCNRGRATENYCIFGTYDFFEWKTGKYHLRDSTRSACNIGLFPANGLVYTPPNTCACRVMMQRGFSALAYRKDRIKPDSGNRLETGPASGAGAANGVDFKDAEWPIYRHDVGRTGATEENLPAGLKQLWEVPVAGGLTAPTVAGGLVFAASKDEHSVTALDAATGKKRWVYTAGGPVDTPPTIWGGLALFGCRDGWVYCLRATDGKLSWRFRAAPIEQRIMVDGRLESAWPVHGSVLVEKGVAQFSAGWHTGLDGGISYYKLEARSGKVVSREHLEKMTGDARRPPNKIAVLPTAMYKGRRTGFGTSGVMDSDWWSTRKNRWMWSDSRKIVRKYLACGSKLTVGIQGRGLGHGGIKWGHGEFNIAGMVKGGKWGSGKMVWGPVVLPIRMRAMIIAGGSVVTAGRTDPMIPESVLKTKDNRRRRQLIAALPAELKKPEDALLLIHSSVDGKKQGEVKLGAPPVFDGLAAAGGKVYVSCQDGKLRCFGKK